VSKLICLKDLASRMQLSPRSVRRWWKILDAPPTIPGHSSHRWTEQAAERFVKKWRAYWLKRNKKREHPTTPTPCNPSRTHSGPSRDPASPYSASPSARC